MHGEDGLSMREGLFEIEQMKEFSMRKIFCLALCLLVLISCRTLSTSTVTYEPKPQNIKDPLPIMKKIIEQQPPSIAYMPNFVDNEKSDAEQFIDAIYNFVKVQKK